MSINYRSVFVHAPDILLPHHFAGHEFEYLQGEKQHRLTVQQVTYEEPDILRAKVVLLGESGSSTEKLFLESVAITKAEWVCEDLQSRIEEAVEAAQQAQEAIDVRQKVERSAAQVEKALSALDTDLRDLIPVRNPIWSGVLGALDTLSPYLCDYDQQRSMSFLYDMVDRRDVRSATPRRVSWIRDIAKRAIRDSDIIREKLRR